MLKKISLLGSALACAFLVNSPANAESWIPIKFGNFSIVIPQISFTANKLTESSYELKWTAQSSTKSYKIERLSLKSVTADEVDKTALPTQWEVIAETTDSSYTVNHDITSFDLGGHQTYRLSICENTKCDQVATTQYFIKSENLSNTVPQNFVITESRAPKNVLVNEFDIQLTSGVNSKRKALTNDIENPYAYGKGFSMLTGHSQPESKKEDGLLSNLVNKGKALLGLNRNQMTQTNQITLDWDLVDGASHYVVVRTVLKENYPTKSFLNNSDLRDWASQNSYTYELAGGEYEFKVYACFDKYETDALNGYCGGASAIQSLTFYSAPDTRYQPKDVKFSVGDGQVSEHESFDITWNAPEIWFNETYDFKEYRVAGELAGYIGTFTLYEEARLTRNSGQAEAPYLAPGRQYCYKVLPIYRTNTNQEFKGEPGYPAPHQCMTVGDQPPIKAPDYLSILEQPGVNGNYGIGYHYTWGDVNDAAYYQLDINKPYGSANWEPLYIGPNTTFQHIMTTSENVAVRVSACVRIFENKGDLNGKIHCGNYRRLYFWAEGQDFTGLAEYRTASCLTVPETVPFGEPVEIKWCEPFDDTVSRYEIVEKSNGTVANSVPSSFDRDINNVMKFGYNIGAGEYCFDVISHYDNDNESFNVGEKCGYVALQTPSQPTITVLDAINAEYQLSWQTVNLATSYKIERASCSQDCENIDQEDWEVIHTAYDTTSTDLTNNPGGKVAFRIIACSNHACSYPSAHIEAESRVVRYIINDHLGTPVAETDQNGDVL